MTAAGTSATIEAPPVGGRIPELDGLRGLAILLVLVYHYVAVHVRPAPGSALADALFFTRLTWSGVDLFFVLSGFLIGGILIDVRGSKRYFGPFYARRFFRIVPIYAALCGLFALGVWAGGAHAWGDAGSWVFGGSPPAIAFAFFFQNVYVGLRGGFVPLSIMITWSLAVEEQFYLTLPMLVRFLRPRTLLRVMLVVIALAPIARTVVFYAVAHGGHYDYAMMPLRADALLLGAAAAMLVRDPIWWARIVRHRRALKIAGATLAAVLLVFMRLRWTTRDSAAMCTIGYSLVALFYLCVLLVAVTRRRGRLAGVLRMRWLRGLGAIAYGTYLLHVAVQGLCFALVLGHKPRLANLADLGTTVLALAVTLVIAQLSWVLFEKRMVRLGHRVRYDAAGA
jgi:peptidoglycan/LPS O-acetylase OafA/YrhL